MDEDTQLTTTVLRFAAHKTLRYLETSFAWQQFTLAENQFHTGDDPILADGESHQQFEQAARSHPGFGELNVWGIVGEEKIRPAPASLNPGTRVFVIDPLDGSTVWSMMRQGYCVAALSLLAKGDGTFTFECGILATPVHTFTYADAELLMGASSNGPKNDTLLFSAVPESGVRPKSLAINGYKARDRELVVDIMQRLPDWDIVTIAGNPANPYVATGMLTATVNTNPQCVWDALGILFCTATDAVVGDLEETLVSGPGFRALYSKLLLEGHVKCIPPMVVAKNADRFHEVASAVAQAIKSAPRPPVLEP